MLFSSIIKHFEVIYIYFLCDVIFCTFIGVPAHKSDKSLAVGFVSYFQDKIVKIGNCFHSIDNINPGLPSNNTAQFTAFSEISVDTVHTILLN